jgi:hypothetical protein
LDEEQARLLRQWRVGYADPDALQLWRGSEAAEAAAYAFSAVAQDGGVLGRVEPAEAATIAVQAQAFANALLVRHIGDGWWAAAQFVVATLAGAGFAEEAATPEPVAVAAEREMRGLWQMARRSYPQFDEATGRLAADAALRLGAGLAEVRRPWDRVIALGAIRFAADSVRGVTSVRGVKRLPSALRDPEVLGVIEAIRGYVAATGASPTLVRYAGGRAVGAQLALGLARDAMVLDEHLRDAVAAGKAAPSAIFRQAINLHGFAIVALHRALLLRLPIEEARQIARAALAFAASLAADPDGAVMPLFPEGMSPVIANVARDARACLPGHR